MENDAPYRDAQPHVRSQKGGPSGFKTRETARENRLLATLPPMAYKRLLPHLKRRFIEAGDILHEAGSPIERIYFIESGVATLGVATENGGYTYIAPVGNEGVIGLAGIMPANWPLFAAHVQISGVALEISPQALRSALKRNRRLHDLLLHYSYLLSEQIGQGAACLRYHSSEERLARLILEIRERVASNPILLTHAEIAMTFGRSRSLITGGVKALKSKGLIDYSPGRIVITDLEGLKAASCECYRSIIQKILPEETFKH
jgi:CRP-like cAMP-binding protein